MLIIVTIKNSKELQGRKSKISFQKVTNTYKWRTCTCNMKRVNFWKGEKGFPSKNLFHIQLDNNQKHIYFLKVCDS